MLLLLKLLLFQIVGINRVALVHGVAQTGRLSTWRRHERELKLLARIGRFHRQIAMLTCWHLGLLGCQLVVLVVLTRGRIDEAELDSVQSILCLICSRFSLALLHFVQKYHRALVFGQRLHVGRGGHFARRRRRRRRIGLFLCSTRLITTTRCGRLALRFAR